MRCLRGLVLVLAAGCSAVVPAFAAEPAPVYVVGVVPQFETRRLADIWQPIVDEVSRRSGVRLVLHLSPSIPAFEKDFSKGVFDFAYMNPYHLIVANEKQGYRPIARDVATDLRGIIVVRQDSKLKSVKELDGKRVAFPAPNALGAALIPRAEFRNKFSIRVQELYSRSHSSVYLNVVLGLADAGGGVEATLQAEPKEVREQLRVLYHTQSVPPHPMTVHPRVPAAVRKQVQAALLELAKEPAGGQLLANVPITKIGVSSMQEYEELRRLRLADFYVE